MKKEHRRLLIGVAQTTKGSQTMLKEKNIQVRIECQQFKGEDFFCDIEEKRSVIIFESMVRPLNVPFCLQGLSCIPGKKEGCLNSLMKDILKLDAMQPSKKQ